MNLHDFLKIIEIQKKWINGTSFVDLEDRESRVEATKKEIDKVRRQLLRRKPPSVTSNEKQRENALRLESLSRLWTFINYYQIFILLFSVEDYFTEDQISRNRMSQLKKDEQHILYEKEKLISLRSLHIR